MFFTTHVSLFYSDHTEPMSMFKNVTASFNVDLRMFEMGQLKQAAKAKIAENIVKYVQELDGTVLSYERVRPVGKYMYVYADTPALHMRMTGDILVFRPYKGCRLPATVTYVSSSAVSLQVLDNFQGYLDISAHKEMWKFEEDRWYKLDGNESFGRYETVVVEVVDVTPMETNGVSFEVKIVGTTDIPVQVQDDEPLYDKDQSFY